VELVQIDLDSKFNICKSIETEKKMTSKKIQKDTSFKQLESEIQSLKQALELKNVQLKEKTEQLELAQQHLVSQKRLVDLGTFIAGIVHEVLNPLGYAYTYIKETETFVKQQLKENLKEVDLESFSKEKEIKELFKLILDDFKITKNYLEQATSLIKVMRLQAYKWDDESFSHSSLIEFNQSIKSVFNIVEYSKTIIDLGLKVNYEFDFDNTIDKIPLVAEDFIKIFTNLLNNSFDSVLTKKRKLGEGYKPEIKIKTTKNKESIAVEVYDNGEGISKDMLEKIFEPFVTTKSSSEGTGIGLFIVRDLVEKNHWKIEVESEEGQYAIFKLIL